MQPLRNALKRSVSAPMNDESNLVVRSNDPGKTLQTLMMLSNMGYRNVWCKAAEVNAEVIQRAGCAGWRICDASEGNIKFTKEPLTPAIGRVSPTDVLPEPLPSPYAQLSRSNISKDAAARLVSGLLGPKISPAISVSAPLEDASGLDESEAGYFSFTPARSRLTPLGTGSVVATPRRSHLRRVSKDSASSTYSQDSDLSSIREVPEPPSPAQSQRSFRPPTPELRIGQTRRRLPIAPPLDRDNFFAIGAEEIMSRRGRTAAGHLDAARPESPTLPLETRSTTAPLIQRKKGPDETDRRHRPV